MNVLKKKGTLFQERKINKDFTSWTAKGHTLDPWAATGRVWQRIVFFQIWNASGLEHTILQNDEQILHQILHHFVWRRSKEQN